MKDIFKKTFFWINKNKGLIVAIFLVGLLPSIAHAGIIADVQGAIIDSILKPIVYGLGSLLIFLINLLTYLFEYNDFLTVPVINQGWIVVRDLLNMTFILVMMVMAIATIVPFDKISNYNYKSMMLKLVVAAITINFSKVILGVIIDACQIVMLQFVSSFREAIAVNLADGALLPQILSLSNQSPTEGELLSVIISLMFAIVFLVIFAFVLLVYGLVLLYRIISLWIIIMLSPIMFFAQIGGPMLAKVSQELWSKFWSQVTIGITLAFFMWLALMVLYMTDEPQSWMSGEGAGQIAELNDLSNQGGASEKNVCASQACEYYNILRFLIAIMMLMQALQYAQKSGGFAGKFAGNVSSKITSFGAGALGGFGAAKYLQGRGKKAWDSTKAFGAAKTKKAWDSTKAFGATLGTTAYQSVKGGIVNSRAGRYVGDKKDKLKESMGVAGMGMAATGTGMLAAGLTTGGIGAVAVGAYGLYKTTRAHLAKNKKFKTDKEAAFKNSREIEEKQKGMFLDANGAETTEEKANARWDRETQSYKKLKLASKDANGKTVFEGEAGYDATSAKKEMSNEVITDTTGKHRQRFQSYKDIDGVERRYNENTGNFEDVKGEKKAIKAKKAVNEVDANGKPVLDENNKNVKKVVWDEKQTRPSTWTASWRANDSKFGKSTDEPKKEKLDKEIAKIDKLDTETLKQLIKSGAATSTDRKAAAVALARRGEELPNDVRLAASKAVANDTYAKKEYEKSMAKAGNVDHMKDKDGNINIDKLAEAFKKKEISPEALKASQINSQVLEAIFRNYGKKSTEILQKLGDNFSSKQKINSELDNYFSGNTKFTQGKLDTKTTPEMQNADLAKQIYGRMTGNYANTNAKDPGNGKVVMDAETLTKYFKKTNDADVFANVTVDQLNLPAMQEAIYKSENTALLTNLFRNDNIEKEIKEKIAGIINKSAATTFKQKITKDKVAANYFS